jgi:hypothetical protein
MRVISSQCIRVATCVVLQAAVNCGFKCVGAEFDAMKNGSYKLRMMGVTLGGLTYLYGYYMSVVSNTQCPDMFIEEVTLDMLPRGTQYCCYGRINHWECAFCYPSEIFNTVVTGGHKRNHLIRLLIHDLCD